MNACVCVDKYTRTCSLFDFGRTNCEQLCVRVAAFEKHAREVQRSLRMAMKCCPSRRTETNPALICHRARQEVAQSDGERSGRLPRFPGQCLRDAPPHILAPPLTPHPPPALRNAFAPTCARLTTLAANYSMTTTLRCSTKPLWFGGLTPTPHHMHPLHHTHSTTCTHSTPHAPTPHHMHPLHHMHSLHHTHSPAFVHSPVSLPRVTRPTARAHCGNLMYVHVFTPWVVVLAHPFTPGWLCSAFAISVCS